MAVGEALQIRSLTELAEAAAAVGDYASAARHLRDLASLQETELGPAHPDLANTLNNLAVAAEQAGDLDTAEGAFRRASVITRAAFDAGHPSVTTSARNLREFCEAHGRAYEGPASAPIPAVDAVPEPVSVPTRSLATLAAVGALGGLAAAAILVWLLTDRTGAPQSVSASASAAAERSIESKPTPTRATDAPPAAPPTPAAPAAVSAPAPERPSSAASVVAATVCSEFSTSGADWRCTPVTDAAASGPLVFYTRIKAAEPTTIEHRWFHGERLVQRVDLRVSANTGAGYRTFSRQTVTSDRTGNWRVELRSADGAVLSEQSFVVP
jgi:hypothetical protein